MQTTFAGTSFLPSGPVVPIETGHGHRNANDGIDPIIGQNPASNPQPWSRRNGEKIPLDTQTDSKDFVTMRGGEYFGAPFE